MDADDKRKAKKAREHPVRAEILGLHRQDSGLSLAANDLAERLDSDLSLSAIAYHVRVLQDAKLLPVHERA